MMCCSGNWASGASSATERSVTRGDRLFQTAMAMVREAIEAGLLPRLDGSISCVDCDKPAVVYDHRDYRKPLMVVPVCKGCNIKRGPALPELPPDQQQSYKLAWFSGNAGMAWSNMEGGEGYSPLECVCRIDTRPIQEMADLSCELAIVNATFNGVMRARRPSHTMAGSARCEYFKAHDPWRVT